MKSYVPDRSVSLSMTLSGFERRLSKILFKFTIYLNRPLNILTLDVETSKTVTDLNLNLGNVLIQIIG